MKVKQILAGALAGLMVVTSVPASNWIGETVYAEETAYTYVAVDDSILMENATANSEQWPVAWDHDGPAEYAFNGDSSNWWHGRYQDEGYIGQHHSDEYALTDGEGAWIGSGFGRSILLGQITYMARTDENANGRIKKYELYTANVEDGVTPTDEDFILVESSKSDTLEACKDNWGKSTITLETPVQATHFRLKAVELHDSYNVNQPTASEIKVYEAVVDLLAGLRAKIEEANTFISNNSPYDCSSLQALVNEAQALVDADSEDVDAINAKEEALADAITNFRYVFTNENGTGVYLSDLDWNEGSYSGYGDIKKDAPVNGTAIAVYRSGSWLQYRKGIGTHAYSEITYDLGAEYKAFEAYAGPEWGGNGSASMQFSVYLDDSVTPVFKSSEMGRETDSEYVFVDVTGVQTLKLVVDDLGGNGGDHAAWADAKLYTSVNAVNKDALNAAINAANEKQEADYTGSSWAALQAALTAANALKEDASATQSAIDQATAALTDAIGNLVARAEFTTLNDAITAAEEQLDAEDINNYTEDSVNNLRTKLEESKTVAANTDASQETVDAAKDALTEAVTNLVLKDADYTAVDNAIAAAAAVDRSDKTDESLTAMDTAVLAVVRGKKITEQEAVNAMAQSILDAIDGLETDDAKVAAKELAAAKEALTAKIAEAEAFINDNSSVYDCSSLQALVDEAQALVDAEGTTAADANARGEALDAAMTDFQKVFKNDNGTGVYLSDLDWNEDSYLGYGNIQKDNALSGNVHIYLYNGSYDQEFLKGIGTHATSEITYDIEGKGYQVFETYLGADCEENQGQTMAFEIYVDDVLVYESGEMGRWATMQHAVVDVRGAATLKLVVRDLGDNSGDHASWADAKLYTDATSTRTVSVSAGEGGAAVATAADSVPFGTKVTFTATPEMGYKFVNWTNTDGEAVSTEEEYTVTVAADMALTANFIAETDFTNLNSAIEEAAAIETEGADQYTGTSWDVFVGALEAARGVAANTEAAQTEVNDAETALRDAITALIKRADFQTLNEAIAAANAKLAAEDIENYTDASVQNLRDQLAAAEAVAANTDSTQEAINTAIDALNTAIDNLELKSADYSAVDTAKANAQTRIGSGLYTDATVAALQEAVNAVVDGKTILEQAEVDGMAAAINTAIAGLRFEDAAGTGVYLSDLDWESQASGWEGHPSRKDQGVDNDTITLYNGTEWKEFAKGIGTHATSEIIYNIAGQGYKKFEAYAGINNEHDGSVKFKVYVDDELKFETTDTVYKNTGMVFVSVDVSAASSLKLEVTDEGSNGNDHAAWADAKLYTSLKTADKAALDEAINTANEMSEANYTEESWAAVAAALAAAIEVQADESATQSVIDQAVENLNNAIADLVLRDADYTAVNDAIAKANEVDRSDKTDESLAALDAALAAVVEGKKITEQEAVNAMAQSILAAIEGLETDDAKAAAKELAAAKEALTAKIAEAEAFISDNSVYDCSELQILVDAAKNLMDAEETTVAEVNARVEALDAAMTDFQKVFKNDNGTGVYLSDLDWNEDSYSGWESIQKDRSNGGNIIKLYNGSYDQEFSKGIGTHATSEITYDIEGKGYQVLETYLGADCEENQNQTMAFEIYVDDVLVYESGTISRADAMKYVVVDVRDAKTLKLVVKELGNKDGDHADWADAKLYTDTTIGRANISAIAGNGGAATVSANEALIGSQVTFTAVADANYRFVNWTNAAGEEVSTDSVYKAIVTENMELKANFAQVIYRITVNGEQVKEGPYNTKVQIIAPDAPEGQVFAGWRVDGKIISTKQEYTFYIANDMDFEAVFEEEEAEINPSANMTNTILTERADGKANIRFAAQLVVPEGYTVVETGLLWCSKETPEIMAENGVAAAGVKKTVSPTMNMSYQFSVTINGVPAGRFVRGMIYAQVRNNKTGEVTWVYSTETKVEYKK